MHPMTCNDVEQQIELFASGECDAPTETAIRRHIIGCAHCAKTEMETRQFLDLLDMRLQEPDRLERLLDRIGIESKPTPQTLPISRRDRAHSNRRWFALAASILLPIGIGIWLTPPAEQPDMAQSKPELTVALLPDRSARGHEKLAPPQPTIDKADVEMALTFQLQAAGQTTKAYRSNLIEAAFKGQQPDPPEVHFLLQIGNPTDQLMRLHFDDPRAELRLSLTGPGALRVNARSGADPLAGLRIVDIPPGSTRSLPITRLIGGSRGQPVYWYWTEPGAYRLRATLNVPIESSGRTIVTTIPGRSVPIRVK